MDLPESFRQQMQLLLGEEAKELFGSLSESSPTSIRLNVHKKTDCFPSSIQATVPWCPSAYYLKNRPVFTLDPLFHAGCYYVQEASSMFIYQVLNQALTLMEKQESPVKALDLCAAPGGKSTVLLDHLPQGSLLVSNEIDHHRANVLAENLTKWGNENIIVTQSEASSLAQAKCTFDLIVTDVPCSGEGMFRKEADALSDWSLDNVSLCATRQRSILQDCWPSLRPGGCLIYSTCTFNRQEDEENVQWIAQQLGAKIIPLFTASKADSSALDRPSSNLEQDFSSLGIHPSLMPEVSACRFFPHRITGEGFFIALLQKQDGESRNERKAVKQEKNALALHDFIHQADDFVAIQSNDGLYRAFPASHLSTLYALKENVRLLTAGICLGEKKGKDFIPHISLALSNVLQKDNFPKCALEKEQALSYLRRESFALPSDTPKGFVLVTYQGFPLGWMKNVGQRANNLYPNEWRIRTL